MVKIQETIHRIQVADRKFRHSCRQILLLNHQIHDKKVRFERARQAYQKSWRYNLRLQLTILQGIKDAFCEYAYKQTEVMEELQEILVEQGILFNPQEEEVVQGEA